MEESESISGIEVALEAPPDATGAMQETVIMQREKTAIQTYGLLNEKFTLDEWNQTDFAHETGGLCGYNWCYFDPETGFVVGIVDRRGGMVRPLHRGMRIASLKRAPFPNGLDPAKPLYIQRFRNPDVDPDCKNDDVVLVADIDFDKVEWFKINDLVMA